MNFIIALTSSYFIRFILFVKKFHGFHFSKTVLKMTVLFEKVKN